MPQFKKEVEDFIKARIAIIDDKNQSQGARDRARREVEFVHAKVAAIPQGLSEDEQFAHWMAISWTVPQCHKDDQAGVINYPPVKPVAKFVAVEPVDECPRFE